MPERSSVRLRSRRRILGGLVLTGIVAAALASASVATAATVVTAVTAATPPADEGSGEAAGSPTSPVIVAPDPSVPRPDVPGGLPGAIEGPAPYVRQVSCDPSAKPGAVALGRLIARTYPGASYGVSRPCGMGSSVSEHFEGRAVDWMVSVRDPQGAAKAAAFIDWLLATDADGNEFANARRLGVMYLIWNDRIWGSYSSAAGWRAYSTCATHTDEAWDTNCHRDHVHISLSWAGAMRSTSFWTKKVASHDYGPCRPSDLNWAPVRSGVNLAPCPAHPGVTAPAGSSASLGSLFRYSGAVVGQGSTGPVVQAVQTGLGITVDGRFGPATASAVAGFRQAQRLAAGSRMDAVAWRALLTVSSEASAKSTTSGPKAGRSAAKASPLTQYKHLVLEPGAKGPAVTAVQRALKVTPASGWYGPVTKATVQRYQKAKGIPATGNVGPLTWTALGA